MQHRPSCIAWYVCTCPWALCALRHRAYISSNALLPVSQLLWYSLLPDLSPSNRNSFMLSTFITFVVHSFAWVLFMMLEKHKWCQTKLHCGLTKFFHNIIATWESLQLLDVPMYATSPGMLLRTAVILLYTLYHRSHVSHELYTILSTAVTNFIICPQ